MSDFSRISEEVIEFVRSRFGGTEPLRTSASVKVFLEHIEPLLVGPHVAYIVGTSTKDESDRDYMDGMVRRLAEVEDATREALDDLNPRGGAVTRKSVQVSSDGDLYISNNVTGTVHDSVAQVGVFYGDVHTQRRQR